MVVHHPKLILAVFTIISALAATQLKNLTQDPTPYLLPPSHESRVNLHTLRQEYTGSNDGVIVLLETPDGIFNFATLTRIKALTQAFETIDIVTREDRLMLSTLSEYEPAPIKDMLLDLSESDISADTWIAVETLLETLSGSPEENRRLIEALEVFRVKLFPVTKVTSLANTDNILGKNGRLDVSPIFEDVPNEKASLALIQSTVHSNELFKRILVSDNDQQTSIIIELGLEDDQTEERFQIYQKIKSILETEITGNERHYIAGMPVVTGALGKVMQSDTQRLFPIVLIIVVFCLYISFRRVKGILVPLAVVILSLIITLGLKALLHIPLNIITTTLPVFILSIGVADGIHIFSEYRDTLEKGNDKIDAIKQTLNHLTIPVIMTSITTSVAFLAISMTRIIQLKHFGIFVAAGTLIAMVFSLLFIPALLVVLPEKRPRKSSGPSRIETVYSNLLIRLTTGIVSRPFITASIACIIFIAALFGASKVVVDNNNVEYFLKDSDIYRSTQKLNHAAAGSAVINFLIRSKSGEEQAFKNPETLLKIDDLVHFIEKNPIVGKVLGLTELIKRIHYVLNDEQPAFDRIPDLGKQMISQLLLLYENGGGDVLSDYTDTNYTAVNIPVIVRTNSSLKMHHLIKEVTAYAGQHLPETLTLSVSGSANVAVAATDEIVSGQLFSLMASLAIVFIMLLFTFRTIGYATIAMIPLVMTLAINFGIMGFFKIPLNIGTAIISSIVIGIGVDYGIHYISRFRQNRRLGMEFQAALENTVRHSGKAIMSNAVTVGAGFVALLFSVLTPLITMGWMITMTMCVSAAATLLLIPILIVFIEKPAIRFVLKDLGNPALPAPQQSIKL